MCIQALSYFRDLILRDCAVSVSYFSPCIIVLGMSQSCMCPAASATSLIHTRNERNMHNLHAFVPSQIQLFEAAERHMNSLARSQGKMFREAAEKCFAAANNLKREQQDNQ